MKRGIQIFVSVIVMGMLFLAGCTTGQPPAIVSSPTSSPTAIQSANAVSPSGQGATSTTTRVRPTRAAATGTPTATKSPATPTAMPETPTPPVFPTATISALGQMALPDKFTAMNFPDNATTSAINVNLVVHQPVAYQLQAKAGQVLNIAVNGETNLQVFGPNKNALSNIIVMPGYFSLVLPDTGTYTIGLDGLGNTIMSVYLPTASDNLASAAPLPAKVSAVKVPAMPFSVFVESKLAPGVTAGYSFGGQAGETLTLALQYNVVPVLLAPDGNTLIPDISSFDHTWLFSLPEDGTYNLVLLGTTYAIVQIKVTALPTAGAAAAAPSGSTRIVIPVGAKSLTFNTYFDPSKPKTYIINTGNGLSMTISISGSVAISKMTGPDNTVVVPGHSMFASDWSASLTKGGDYTLVFTGSGPSTLTFSIPLNTQITPYVTPTY
jgi:hypothetical protein